VGCVDVEYLVLLIQLRNPRDRCHLARFQVAAHELRLVSHQTNDVRELFHIEHGKRTDFQQEIVEACAHPLFSAEVELLLEVERLLDRLLPVINHTVDDFVFVHDQRDDRVDFLLVDDLGFKR